MMEVDEVVISDGSEGAEIQNHPQTQTQPASEQPQPDLSQLIGEIDQFRGDSCHADSGPGFDKALEEARTSFLSGPVSATKELKVVVARLVQCSDEDKVEVLAMRLLGRLVPELLATGDKEKIASATGVIGAIIKEIAVRKRYGLMAKDMAGFSKAELAQRAVWRWEVKDPLRSYFEPDTVALIGEARAKRMALHDKIRKMCPREKRKADGPLEEGEARAKGKGKGKGKGKSKGKAEEGEEDAGAGAAAMAMSTDDAADNDNDKKDPSAEAVVLGKPVLASPSPAAKRPRVEDPAKEAQREAERLEKEAKKEAERLEREAKKEAEKAERKAKLDAEKAEREAARKEKLEAERVEREAKREAEKAEAEQRRKEAEAKKNKPVAAMAGFMSSFLAKAPPKPAPAPVVDELALRLQELRKALLQGERLATFDKVIAGPAGAVALPAKWAPPPRGRWLKGRRQPLGRRYALFIDFGKKPEEARGVYSDSRVKRSAVIRGRRPFARDPAAVNYDLDSEEDEIDDAEDILSTDESDSDGSDEPVPEGFEVPDGYLSADEGCSEKDFDLKGGASGAAGAPSSTRVVKRNVDDMRPRWVGPDNQLYHLGEDGSSVAGGSTELNKSLFTVVTFDVPATPAPSLQQQQQGGAGSSARPGTDQSGAAASAGGAGGVGGGAGSPGSGLGGRRRAILTDELRREFALYVHCLICKDHAREQIFEHFLADNKDFPEKQVSKATLSVTFRDIVDRGRREGEAIPRWLVKEAWAQSVGLVLPAGPPIVVPETPVKAPKRISLMPPPPAVVGGAVTAAPSSAPATLAFNPAFSSGPSPAAAAAAALGAGALGTPGAARTSVPPTPAAASNSVSQPRSMTALFQTMQVDASQRAAEVQAVAATLAEPFRAVYLALGLTSKSDVDRCLSLVEATEDYDADVLPAALAREMVVRLGRIDTPENLRSRLARTLAVLASRSPRLAGDLVALHGVDEAAVATLAGGDAAKASDAVVRNTLKLVAVVHPEGAAPAVALLTEPFLERLASCMATRDPSTAGFAACATHALLSSGEVALALATDAVLLRTINAAGRCLRLPEGEESRAARKYAFKILAGVAAHARAELGALLLGPRSDVATAAVTAVAHALVAAADAEDHGLAHAQLQAAMASEALALLLADEARWPSAALRQVTEARLQAVLAVPAASSPNLWGALPLLVSRLGPVAPEDPIWAVASPADRTRVLDNSLKALARGDLLPAELQDFALRLLACVIKPSARTAGAPTHPRAEDIRAALQGRQGPLVAELQARL